MTKPTIHPAILSGGAGTRLWPLSRALYPKQFQHLVHKNSLLQETALRVSTSRFAAPFVVCNEEHRFIVAEQLQAVDLTPDDIILEPVGRDTAPAITIAALHVQDTDPNGLLLVLPSDHVIGDSDSFCDQVDALSVDAGTGRIVTFGVPPTFADPELGYMKVDESNSSNEKMAENVRSFIEKPEEKTAQLLISEGYSWYSGISLFTPGAFLSEMEQFAPETLALCKEAWAGRRRDMDFVRLAEAPYAAIAPSSVDKAVMEQSKLTVMSPLATNWQDIRTWPSVWESSEKNSDGNALTGEVISIDSHNSIVHSERYLSAIIGVDDIGVVTSDDAILVTSMNGASKVDALVEQLAASGSTKHEHHTKIYRPWGSFHSILSAPQFQVKELVVNPGAELSLQKHKYRAEHWVVVVGTAAVRRGDDEMLLHENQSVYIPIGAVHRLANPGRVPLHVIEVQSGTYLGEDDIERLDDTYGRQ